MPNRKKWIRYVLYAVEILLLFLLQDTPGLLPQIMGVKPLPVLSAALTIAMVEACTPAMAFGMYAGFLADIGRGSCVRVSRAHVRRAVLFAERPVRHQNSNSAFHIGIDGSMELCRCRFARLARAVRCSRVFTDAVRARHKVSAHLFLHAFNDTRVLRFAGVGAKAPRAQRHTAAQVKAA